MGLPNKIELAKQISNLNLRVTRAVRKAWRNGDWERVEGLVFELVTRCATDGATKSQKEMVALLRQMVQEKKEERPRRRKAGDEDLFKPMTRVPVDREQEEELAEVGSVAEGSGVLPEQI